MLEGKGINCIMNACTQAETRKRTTYMRIGQQPKVKYKRCLNADEKEDEPAMN